MKYAITTISSLPLLNICIEESNVENLNLWQCLYNIQLCMSNLNQTITTSSSSTFTKSNDAQLQR